jgi:predicted transcriptional regulator
VAERRAMGALETTVLTCLWRSKNALTPAEVIEAMDDPPAYTTVMTILTRLWQKGLVGREMRGRAFAYQPLVSEAELAAQRMRATLLAASDRQDALSHFVGTLTKREERALRQILGDLDPR